MVSRIAALALATLVGFSAPGLALAHGHAHHEAEEKATVAHEHEHGTGVAVPQERGPIGHALLIAANEPDDHAHPQLTLALTIRLDTPTFLLPRVSPPDFTDAGRDTTVSLLLTAAPARASPSDAPPRQPRAPPLG